MNFEEFLKNDKSEATSAEGGENMPESKAADAVEESATENIDVQKAVVESLAADKALQDETISELKTENAALREKVAKLTSEVAELTAKATSNNDAQALRNELKLLKAKCAEQVAALEKVGDVLSRNSETTLSNKISLLDRDAELPDRFPGETREHVLEVIAEARKTAEAEGRIRRAQVLEGVLLANESEGTLAQKREELEKLFTDNANILSGPVIAALEKLGISHKNGEEYLLPCEILKRTY